MQFGRWWCVCVTMHRWTIHQFPLSIDWRCLNWLEGPYFSSKQRNWIPPPKKGNRIDWGLWFDGKCKVNPVIMNRSNEIITRCMYISWSGIQNMPAFIRSDKLWIITFAKLILNSHIMIFDLLILGWCLIRKMGMRCMPWLKTDHA